MAGVEKVVCLQMITCHNTFLNFSFFPPKLHEKHKVRKEIVVLRLEIIILNKKLEGS